MSDNIRIRTNPGSKETSVNVNVNQKFDFNNSSLSRNTLGYKILESNSSNDFVIENNTIKQQEISVDHISQGSISGISVINSGDNYKVNDLLNFDNDDTNGGGIYANVSSLKGRKVDKIDTLHEVYNDAIFTWSGDNKVNITISPFHTLSNNDNVLISGFSTSNLSVLNDSFKVNQRGVCQSCACNRNIIFSNICYTHT